MQAADATNVGADSNTASVRTAGAAATTFTDDPLVSGVTVLKAVHITELRTAPEPADRRATRASTSV